ncbi:alpha-1,2-fucosyltransferase [Roseovarius sp. SYSU LYC5161]|uniref:alpha-1,2-fucosyltransferase n=1 Tax=Roseovarius halophilus (ex Wu et al. 2025) TaxID=3376060 RepID=UPI00399BC38A
MNKILRLQGGIGNQLFQFWAAYFYSQLNDCKLTIDTGNYPPGFNFCLIQEIIPELDFDCIPTSLLERVLQRHIKLPFLNGMRIYHEKQMMYDPSFWNHSTNTQLMMGYFQSFRYFLDPDMVVEETLRALSQSASGFNEEILEQEKDLVSVHIRRGDYSNNVHTLKYHGICSDGYYLNAMKLIKRLNPDVRFVVFTNDLPYARMLFSKEPVYFANELFKSSSDREEMYLMSKCKFNIISNSSFSWWSAYLNKSPEKLVIAPSEWYGFPYDSQDLLPVDWLKISK